MSIAERDGVISRHTTAADLPRLRSHRLRQSTADCDLPPRPRSAQSGIGVHNTNMNLRFFTIISLASFLLAACLPPQTQTAPVVIDRDELQNFSDVFFAEQLDSLHIPGVVVVFVQKGEVIFAKGYGYTNLGIPTPLDPESSIMRIGSISKPFVATAVMQLVEQGKLDLHTDVNRYFTTFQIKDSFPEPVTLAQLLTHTSGFEDPSYVSNTDPPERLLAAIQETANG